MRRALSAALGAVLVVVAPAHARRPPMRGVVEGYYGRPWPAASRRAVIRFLGAHGLTTFLYAPKNDELHRERWREPYPRADLNEFRRTARAARRAGVRFMYGISPGLDVCYSCREDAGALREKLAQLGRTGISRFALLLDDTPARLSDPRDQAFFGGADEAALGRAQAQLANETARWLARNRVGRLDLVVPTIYWGTECRPYHEELARLLGRSLKVAWTGTGVFSATLSAADARARRACLPRHGIVLWDNFPVNDTLLTNNLHLGPLTGRDPALPEELAGYLLNPMTQAHASLVALGTAAAYLRHPRRYRPERAWREALREVGGRSSLAILAAQTRGSFLDLDDARDLAAIVEALAATYDGAQWMPAVDALDAEVERQATAAAALPRELAGSALGAEIAPWVGELGAHAARGMEAARLLRAMKPAVGGLRVAAAREAWVRLDGRVVPAAIEAAVALGEGFLTEAARIEGAIARPDVLGYLRCLGDLFGPGIHPCPEFGLNVHGKVLYFYIQSAADVRVVTGRSVYDRLVRFVASRYASWLERRSAGADATTVAVVPGGDVVMPDADGSFTLLVPAPRAVPLALRVRASGGEETMVEVAAP
jgi:hyaluronoglucosaminidase